MTTSGKKAQTHKKDCNSWRTKRNKVWFFYKLHFSLVKICPSSFFIHGNLLSSCLLLKCFLLQQDASSTLSCPRITTKTWEVKLRWYAQRNNDILIQIPTHKSSRKAGKKTSHFSVTRNRTTGKNNAFCITVGSFNHPKETKNKSFLRNILIHTCCCRRIPDLCILTEIRPNISLMYCFRSYYTSLTSSHSKTRKQL